MKKALNYDEAWKIQETLSGQPHGWIQFKGTDLCMDVHCACGELTHIDGMFIYYVKCNHCGRMYMLNGHIEMIEIEQEPLSIHTTSVVS